MSGLGVCGGGGHEVLCSARSSQEGRGEDQGQVGLQLCGGTEERGGERRRIGDTSIFGPGVCKLAIDD